MNRFGGKPGLRQDSCKNGHRIASLDVMPQQKDCRVCGQSFPCTAQFWYSDGGCLQNECKACAKARIKAWKAEHRERDHLYHQRAVAKRIAERHGETVPPLLRPLADHRICSRCKQDFPRTNEFWHTNAAVRDGLHTVCRSCAKAKSSAHYVAIRDANREALRERNRKNYAANKEAAAARAKRYKARRKAGGRVTKFDLGIQFERQKGLCFYCRKSIADRKFDVDHYIPLSKGGKNEPSNIVLACPTCNNSKHAKLPSEFQPK